MDPARRIAKWNAKYDTERVKGALDAMRPTMLANVTAVFPMLTAMELQVKQVCDGSGVPTIQYPYYLNFGREIWALTRKEVSGESLAREVAVLGACPESPPELVCRYTSADFGVDCLGDFRWQPIRIPLFCRRKRSGT